MKTVAIWNWRSDPVPDARLIVTWSGDEEFCALPADRREAIQRTINDEPGYRAFVIPYGADGRALYPEHKRPAHIIPAIHVERQADLAQLPALLAVQAERRALVVSPREAIDLRRVIGRGSYPGNIPGHCVDIDGCTWHKDGDFCNSCGWGYPDDPDRDPKPRPDLVIVCGFDEPLHPAHTRSVIEQCKAAGVAVILQWGAHCPVESLSAEEREKFGSLEGVCATHLRIGAERSGSMLDGVAYDELPGWIA